VPRLFTGIEIPSQETAALALLRGGLPGARWIEPEDYHITLRFIGDVGVAMANEIASELDTIRARSLTATIEGVGVFGGDRPRAIIAKVAPTGALGALQAEHERMMRRIGAPPEPRKFVPHVTLARLRGVSPENVAAYIESRESPGKLEFPVERFVLYSSRESTGGGPYRVEAAYPL
jgi:2'-5' RNA ligase